MEREGGEEREVRCLRAAAGCVGFHRVMDLSAILGFCCGKAF